MENGIRIISLKNFKIMVIIILLFIILLGLLIVILINNPIISFYSDEIDYKEIVTRESVLSFKAKYTIHIHFRRLDGNGGVIVDFNSFIPFFSKSIYFSKHDVPAPVPNIYR